MKATFIYCDNCAGNRNKFNIGIASLSGYLKKEGFNTSLIHISSDINEDYLRSKIERHNPDLLAFSYISLTFDQIKKFVGWTSDLPIPKIHGGMHPTMSPEETISVDGIDVICLGEGEETLRDYCHALENGGSIHDIPNLWIKQANGSIRKNPVRPLIENLDSLPPLDYEIFDYPALSDAIELGQLTVQASRGCHFKCTYCGNNYLYKMYPNKNRYLRSFSVDWVIDEIEGGLKKYPFLTNVRFVDDTLTNDPNWFEEFTHKYKHRINLPFSGNDRPENLTQDIVKMLKEAGCFSLDVGIENGDNMFRRKIMKRFMRDEQIIGAFHKLRQADIKTNAFNIFGMVDETKEVTLETVKLNARALPNHFIKAYFTPLVNTEAAEMTKKRGLKVHKNVTSFFEKPQVELKTMRACEIEFFYKYFAPLVYIYNRLYRINIKRLMGLADRIILFRFFPYRIFNKLYFSEAALICLVRRLGIYKVLRPPYRVLKKIFRANTGIN